MTMTMNGVEEKQPALQPVASNVIVHFKQSKPFEIELDADALTWEDLMTLQEIQAKEEKGELTPRESMEALTTLLDRLTGLDTKKLPARVIGGLLAEFQGLAGGLQQETKN